MNRRRLGRTGVEWLGADDPKSPEAHRWDRRFHLAPT
jgi:hypothetical protein